MRKTKIEIINEIKEWYEADPSRRATTPTGKCQYLMDDGRMCAVGRCLINPENIPSGTVFEVWDCRSIDVDLKPEYRGHSMHFWDALQDFHDNPGNWSDNGLTEAGLYAYNRLIQVYS